MQLKLGAVYRHATSMQKSSQRFHSAYQVEMFPQGSRVFVNHDRALCSQYATHRWVEKRSAGG
jgi:hypothetical protein